MAESDPTVTDPLAAENGAKQDETGIAADAGADALLRVDLEAGTLKRRSVHGAAVTLVSQAIRFLFQIGAQIGLARLLTPTDFGLIAMVSPFVGFVQLVNDFGLLEATIQRPKISHRELSALFWISLAISAALAAMFAAAAPLVAWFYNDPRATWVSACLAGLILLGGLAAQQMALMNRRMQFLHLAAIDVGATIAAAVVGIGSAALGYGYWSLVFMQTANSVTVVTLAWGMSRWRPSRPRRERGVGSLLGFGGNVTGANVLQYLSHNLDNVLIGATTSSVELGLYDRAYRLMLLPMIQVTTPFSRIAVPLLSRVVDSEDRYRMAFAGMLQAALLMTIPGILFAIVMAGSLVPFLLGSKWIAAAPIFAWLGGGTLVLPLIGSMTWLLISQGRSRRHLIWGSTGSGLIIVSFLFGLPWGPLGVARASTCFIVFLQLPLLCWTATRDGPVGRRTLGRIVAPFVAAGLVDTVALLAARGALPDPGLLEFVGLGVFTFAVYVAALACLPTGRTALRNLWMLRSSFRAAAA